MGERVHGVRLSTPNFSTSQRNASNATSTMPKVIVASSFVVVTSLVEPGHENEWRD
jgi:hypothetical protein